MYYHSAWNEEFFGKCYLYTMNSDDIVADFTWSIMASYLINVYRGHLFVICYKIYPGRSQEV
jgi:hypothetical protein